MTKRFYALDAFRGVAAIAVVIFHMHLIGSITELKFFRGSSHFVDFFFVLSGFVLTHGYAFKKKLKFYSFVRSRFFRLYPLHLFTLGIFILLEIGKLVAYKYGGFIFNTPPFEGINTISEIIPNMLLIQSWDSTTSLSFNYPSWSISIEFYLYILFFFTITTFFKFKKSIWMVISLIAVYLISTESNVLNTSVLRGLSYFFSGALTYILYKKINHVKPTRSFISVLEILLIILIVAVVQYDFEYHSAYKTLLFCMVVLVFSFEAGILSTFLKMKPFQIAGKLSYSIYMTHAAILFCLISIAMVLQKFTGTQLAPMIDGIRFLTSGNLMINNIVVLFVLAIVLLVSQFTYKNIELRWQEIGRKKS